MNIEQSTHCCAIARKIAAQSRSLALRMEAIERESLAKVPLQTLDPIWAEVPLRTEEINRVLRDMLPRLEELRGALSNSEGEPS